MNFKIKGQKEATYSQKSLLEDLVGLEGKQ